MSNSVLKKKCSQNENQWIAFMTIEAENWPGQIKTYINILGDFLDLSGLTYNNKTRIFIFKVKRHVDIVDYICKKNIFSFAFMDAVILAFTYYNKKGEFWPHFCGLPAFQLHYKQPWQCQNKIKSTLENCFPKSFRFPNFHIVSCSLKSKAPIVCLFKISVMTCQKLFIVHIQI